MIDLPHHMLRDTQPSAVFTLQRYDEASGTYVDLVASAALTDASNTWLLTSNHAADVTNHSVGTVANTGVVVVFVRSNAATAREDLRLYDYFERFRRLALVTTSGGLIASERRSEWPAKKLTVYGEHDCAGQRSRPCLSRTRD